MCRRLIIFNWLRSNIIIIYLLLGLFSSSIWTEISRLEDSESSSDTEESDERFGEELPEMVEPEHPRKSWIDNERRNNKHLIKELQSRLTKLDKLYASMGIKVQQVNGKGELSEAEMSDLYTFMSGVTDFEEIVEIIEKELKRSLLDEEITAINTVPSMNLTEAIRALYQNKRINETKAHAMILNNARIGWDEILKLVDLGAVHTKTGYLLTLKTGEDFGNPIKLFADFHRLAAEIIKSNTAKLHSPSELLLNPIPGSISSSIKNFGPNAADTLSDARVISQIRRHFVFLSSIKMPISFRPGTVDFRPNALMSSGAPINLIDSNGVEWALLKNLNAVYSNNHYYVDHNSSLTNSIMLAPFGLTYWGNYNWTAGGIGWWGNYTQQYLGMGGTYTVNFANGTFWSSAPNYLMIGATVGGWRNYLTTGVSVMTLATTTVGVGASVTGTIIRDHDVYYRGLVPLDHRIPEIRGAHKVEIDDRKGVSGQVAAAANFSNLKVPIMVAFRVGADLTAHRVFRTHVELKDAQRMLSESEIPGVFFLLGKRIKETPIPSFNNPLDFKVGDEFVETKTGKLSGAFVVGLQSQIPIGAVRGGATLDFTAEFELGLRVLPENKIEVSVEPKRIYEIGIFAGILNTIGVGVIDSMSVLKKQSFIFDFNVPDAVEAYFDLIDNGRLPTIHQIEIHPEERGPEYLLTEFRAQNKLLEDRGIALNYMEQVRVSSEKLHAGFSARMISGAADAVNFFDRKLRPNHDRINLKFDGIDWEFMQANAMSVATNGMIAVRKSTSGYRKSRGQGTSGRFNKDLYVTHRRVHMIDDSSVAFTANKWQFDSLLVAAQYEDTMLTGEQENKIASEIDSLFSLNLGNFAEKNSRQRRVVHLERELSVLHLQKLLEQETEDRIERASQRSGVSKASIIALLEEIKDKHPDFQALRVKRFIDGQAGLNGFSAIHHLLGGRPEDITLRTESGYGDVINDGKRFIMLHTDHVDHNNRAIANFKTKKGWRNKRANRKIANGIANNVRHSDYQLRRLHDDQYFIDPNDTTSKLATIYGTDGLNKLISSGARLAKEDTRALLAHNRKILLELFDLKAQGFIEKDRKNIYEMLGESRLDLQSLVDRLTIKYNAKPLSASLSKKHLKKRFKLSIGYIEQINAKLRRLNRDTVMIKMDNNYVEAQIKQYHELKTGLLSLLSFNHVDELERIIIRRKLGKKILSHYRRIVPIERGEIEEILVKEDPRYHQQENFSESSSIDQ